MFYSGPVVMTLLLIGVLVAEHYLADIVYDSLAQRRSKEYVRRYSISLKLSALLIFVYIWAITLYKDLSHIAIDLFWLLALAMGGLGSGPYLAGARRSRFQAGIRMIPNAYPLPNH